MRQLKCIYFRLSLEKNEHWPMGSNVLLHMLLTDALECKTTNGVRAPSTLWECAREFRLAVRSYSRELGITIFNRNI